MEDLLMICLFVGMIVSPCLIAMRSNSDRVRTPRRPKDVKVTPVAPSYTEMGWVLVKK